MAKKQFNAGKYNNHHKKNLANRAAKIKKLFDDVTTQVALIGGRTGFNDPEEEFHWKDYPAAEKAVNKLLEGLTADIEAEIRKGDEQAWELSNAKNDAMLESIEVAGIATKTKAVQWQQRNIDALHDFMDRTTAGMNLSQRVWNLGQQAKAELELALEIGLVDGKSAAELSRDIRRHLLHPDKLFRRVRDKDTGALRLSKAAAAFHPGRGVYRSSYKNALRMTATENNMAYRTADHTRWQQIPFVIGIEIHTSDNHPVPDICDELKGVYPKDFKFIGFHPWCRCYVTTKLADKDDFQKYQELDDTEKGRFKFKGSIEEPPQEFKKWIADNEQRIVTGSSIPYFVKDNGKYLGDIGHEARLRVSTSELQEMKNRGYKDCKLDPKTCAMTATNPDHNIDKKRGWYETKVQEVGYNEGHRVILEAERHDRYCVRSTDGTWDYMPMEIATSESGTANNIRDKLKHCASKPETEVAVVFIPDGVDTSNIKAGLQKYKGLKNTTQWKEFKKIVFLGEHGIISIEK